MLTATSQAVTCGNSHLDLSRPSVLSPSASAPRAKASLVGANTVTFAPGSESTCMHHTWRVPQQVWAPRRRAVPGRLHTRTAWWHSQAGAQSNPQRWGTTHLLQLGGGEGLGKGSQLGVLPDCLQSSRLAAAAAGNDPAVHNQAHKKPDGTGQVVLDPILEVASLGQPMPFQKEGCHAIPARGGGRRIAGGGWCGRRGGQ